MLRAAATIDDRIEVLYEVRDATGWKPDPKRESWWDCLPDPANEAFADRAKRRQGRKSFQLGFNVSKFRVAEWPPAWAVEVDMSTEPWTLKDITEEMENAFEECKGEAGREREQKIYRASRRLEDAVEDAYFGHPRIKITTTQALEILMEVLSRAVARSTLNRMILTVFETRTGRIPPKGGKRPIYLIPRDRPDRPKEDSASGHDSSDASGHDFSDSEDTSPEDLHLNTVPSASTYPTSEPLENDDSPRGSRRRPHGTERRQPPPLKPLWEEDSPIVGLAPPHGSRTASTTSQETHGGQGFAERGRLTPSLRNPQGSLGGKRVPDPS